MTTEEIKSYLSANKRWLVKKCSSTGRATFVHDVTHPFVLHTNQWLDLLVVASYTDIVFSVILYKVLSDRNTITEPANLRSFLVELRANNKLIPQPPKPQPEPACNRDWVLDKIPKIAYFYWGCSRLSFLKFMSLYSFCHFNPDWKVKLYTPSYLSRFNPWDKPHEGQSWFNGLDYSKYLTSLPIEIISLDFREVPFSNRASEVHKSDALRWYLLNKFGGLWSDIDILYFRPMTVWNRNCLSFRDSTGFVARGDEYHRIGFLLSAPDNPFFRFLHDMSLRRIDRLRYQSIGSEMLDKFFPSIGLIQKRYPTMANIDDSTVYFFDNICIYYCFFGNGIDFIRSDSVGLHWYAGAIYVHDLLNYVNHKNYLTTRLNCTPVKILQKYFPKGIKL